MLSFSKLIEPFISFVLPPVCICCGERIDEPDGTVCRSCLNKLEPIKDRIYSAYHIDYFFSLYKFIDHRQNNEEQGSEMQKIIHEFKYKHFTKTGEMFGREAGREIKERFTDKFDYVIPVPLHLAKKRERTYNQSEYICRGISEAAGIVFIRNVLKRKRWTESQTKLTAAERIDNVKDAFLLNKKYTDVIKAKNIVLVDDVVTTGSTITECAKVLKDNGCGKILACSIARAV